MKKKILKAIQIAAYSIGTHKVLRILNKNKVRVLMYHSINGPKEIPDYVKVSKETFEKHIIYLKENYNIMDYFDFLNYLSNFTCPDNSVLLTFDDGYKDNYLFAYPILKKYNIPAIFFINGKRDPTINISNNDMSIMDELIKFGDHSKSHKHLIDLNKKELKEELECKSDIFAYPFGEYNDEIIRLVSNLYLCAFTADEGLVSNKSYPWRFERISITEQSIPEFSITIEGFNKPFVKLYKKLK